MENWLKENELLKTSLFHYAKINLLFANLYCACWPCIAHFCHLPKTINSFLKKDVIDLFWEKTFCRGVINFKWRDCNRNFTWPSMQRCQCQIYKVPLKRCLIKYDSELHVFCFWKAIYFHLWVFWNVTCAFFAFEKVWRNYGKKTRLVRLKRYLPHFWSY